MTTKTLPSDSEIVAWFDWAGEADYLARGRRFEGVKPEQLQASLVEAFEAFKAVYGQHWVTATEQHRTLNDIAAELRIRKLKRVRH